MVAVESALLMFPINILIVTIFRSIKPRIPPFEEKSKSTDWSKPNAVSMQTILKVSESNNASLYDCSFAILSINSLANMTLGTCVVALTAYRFESLQQ